MSLYETISLLILSSSFLVSLLTYTDKRK